MQTKLLEIILRSNMLINNILTINGKHPRQVAKTMILLFIFCCIIRRIKQHFFKHGFRYSCMQIAFEVYKQYHGEIGMNHKLIAIKQQIRESIISTDQSSNNKNVKQYSVLPIKSCDGMSEEQFINQLKEWSNYEEQFWNGSKKFISGGVYGGQQRVIRLQNKAYDYFSISNPTHPDTFPFVRKMESEIIAMTLSLFNGSGNNDCLKKGLVESKEETDYCGLVTSGGTESIILAVRAYKQYAEQTKNVKYPELIVARSAHAAFDKACELMGIKLIQIELDPKTYKMKVEDVRKHITSDTIAIVGSAPNFPQGIIDPIEELAAIAFEYDIGFHVDCCLGSFLAVMVQRTHVNRLPLFDFRCIGVTSISCDTHKYGYSCKGSSVLMFSSYKWRRLAYFCYSDSSIGMYCTPTIMGSRSGGIIASTWATMLIVAEEGYMAAANAIITAVDFVKKGVQDLEEIEIMGNPLLSVIAFKTRDKYSNKISIFKICDAMSDRGWTFNKCQHPNCIHFCFTLASCMKRDTAIKFIKDLKDSVLDVKINPLKYKETAGSIYGTIVAIPENSFKNDILAAYMDVVFECNA